MDHTFMGCLVKMFAIEENNESMVSRSTSGTGRKHGRTPSAKNRTMTRVLQPVHTIRLRPQHEEPVSAEKTREPISLCSWGITDAGQVRDHNEDSFSLLTLEGKSLFVVADGMGGHDSGEVASRTAADTACRIVQQEHERNVSPLPLVERAVRAANTEVRRQGAEKASDMGTTLSLALISGSTAYVANVGDSRVYWMENGSISQVTTDHSLVAKLVEVGKLTKEEARGHPRANLLYRTIGTDDSIKVDTFTVDMKKGGTLLLCTDGLWGELTDEEIRQICDREKDAKEASRKLVQMANERGGKDNITAVVVKIV